MTTPHEVLTEALRRPLDEWLDPENDEAGDGFIASAAIEALREGALERLAAVFVEHGIAPPLVALVEAILGPKP